MELTERSFRALARSSPWRWRTMDFIRHESTSDPWVRARVERPGLLGVTDAAGRTTHRRERAGANSVAFVAVSESDAFEPRENRVLLPQEIEPVWQCDGLVAERPVFVRDSDQYGFVDYGDPMWSNYRWVAMLDPAELAAGTEIGDLTVGVHRGRPAWFATMRARHGFEPRCGCCALLWSAESDAAEFGDDYRPYRAYPESYRGALDVQTGVLVSLVENPPRVEIDLEILAVDA